MASVAVSLSAPVHAIHVVGRQGRILLACCWLLSCCVSGGEAQTTASPAVEDVPLDSSAGVASWTLSSTPVGAADSHIGSVSVPALVPGDVGDDLERAGNVPRARAGRFRGV